jgi:hypothetical protein
MHQSLRKNGQGHLTEIGSIAGLAYCNQAEANDAAPAHTAAHSANDDNKTTTHNAPLVTAMATSQGDRSTGAGLRRTILCLPE